MRRMDRYKDENNTRSSRLDKNQDLYQNVSNNTIYTNITDVINANAFEINSIKPKENDSNYTSREEYQKMRKYQNIEPPQRNRKELDDINHLYQKQENKIYDINSVLEEARKNRVEKDSLDEKRKLKNNNYNILAGLNKKDLEKYREEKKKRIKTPEEEELRDLIDTIASKTLAGEIDKATSVDLLSDLMATNALDKVESSDKLGNTSTEEVATNALKTQELIDEISKTGEKLSLSKEVLQEEKEAAKKKKVSKKEEILQDKDPDFYTRSMDLSDKDFDLSEDFKEGKLPIFAKILLFLLIIMVIAISAYFIYLKIT